MKNERQAFSFDLVQVSARWLIFMSSVTLLISVCMVALTIISSLMTNGLHYGNIYHARRGSVVDSIPLINIVVRNTITNSWGKALLFRGVEWIIYATLNAIVLIGALRMKRFRSYKLAKFACILSCVPCVIAMWPLGALGGAAGLFFLERSDVKRSFVDCENEKLGASRARS